MTTFRNEPRIHPAIAEAMRATATAEVPAETRKQVKCSLLISLPGYIGVSAELFNVVVSV